MVWLFNLFPALSDYSPLFYLHSGKIGKYFEGKKQLIPSASHARTFSFSWSFKFWLLWQDWTPTVYIPFLWDCSKPWAVIFFSDSCLNLLQTGKCLTRRRDRESQAHSMLFSFLWDLGSSSPGCQLLFDGFKQLN